MKKNNAVVVNLSPKYIDIYYRRPSFSLVRLDPNIFSRQAKNRIFKILGGGQYDIDDFLFAAVIIPQNKIGILDFENTYLYVNLRAPDETDEKEIARFISGNKDTYLEDCFFNLNLSIYEQVQLTSLFIPSRNMRISENEKRRKEAFN